MKGSEEMEDPRITRLEQEVAALRQRVAALEGQHTSPVAPEPSEPEVSTVARPAPRPAYTKRKPVVPPPTFKEKRSREEWEQVIATVWLPRIGAIFAALGALFLFSYASVAGLISPPVRIGSGVLIGLLVIALGEYQYEKKRRELGVGLVATGTIVALAALFAGMALYQFYPPSLAFLLELVVVFIAYGLMLWMRSQALLVLVSITGFLLPYLQLSDEPNLPLFLLYEVVLFAAIFFAVDRLKAKKAFVFAWMILTIALAFGLLSLTLSWYDYDNDARRLDEWSVLLAALFGYGATSFVGRRIQFQQNVPSWLAGGVVLLTLLILDWSFGVLAAILFAGIAYVLADRLKDPAQNGVGHVALLVAVLLIPADALSWTYQLRYFLIAGLIAAFWFVPRARMPHQRLFNVGLYVVFIFSAVIDYESYQNIGLSYALTVLAMVVASTAFVLLLVQTHRDPLWKGSWQLVLVLAAIGVFTTYTLIIMELPFYRGLEETARSTTLSAAYIVLALVLVAIGRMRTSSTWRLSGLLLLTISAVKLLLFDLSFLSLFQKAFVFIGFGIVTFIISRTYFKKRKEQA
ncbi:DUF2339 domain-containing protein [Exiguobacterium sp. LL15]|uniref:DUF2339 domain-containing protein n=1 Tax=Exiguobacterium sp. LL15 TaxID=2950547 RepID=UPI00210A4ADC|nr:DUF2339 domain-containing protein [Exiguobacterium sp. LL15]MCQ4090300.1 DUF2339 domain-containing protein [Exiguobacterium sp. LL15]